MAPQPGPAVTYPPLKHNCVSRLPESLCQSFTEDIKTGLNGQIVSLLYTENYFCDRAVRARASTRCEFGTRARRLPPGVAGWRYTDPLYLMFPAGAIARNPLALDPECQFAGLCTDHPSHIDFSRVLGPSGRNMLLPVHDHFETTRNGNRPEWHNLSMFLVGNKTSWFTADASHNVRTLFKLAHTRGSGVRGPFPSNIFFFFQTLPGNSSAEEVKYSELPAPPVTTTSMLTPSIIAPNDSLLDRVTALNGNTLQAFFATGVKSYTVTPASRRDPLLGQGVAVGAF